MIKTVANVFGIFHIGQTKLLGFFFSTSLIHSHSIRFQLNNLDHLQLSSKCHIHYAGTRDLNRTVPFGL